MITSAPLHNGTSGLDAEIERAEIAAEAELCFDAVTGESANPFAGARDRLRSLESERLREQRRARGEVLVQALDAFKAVNGEIEVLGIDHRKTQAAIGELRLHPVIKRFLAAPRYADAYGVRAIWGILGPFLASDAPWESRPTRVSDQYVASLPESLRFLESERPVIREFATLENHAKQLSWTYSILIKRREKLTQDHPALQMLPCTAG